MRVEGREFVVADFETSTEVWYEKDHVARVWLWGIYDPFKDDFKYGKDLDSFMNTVLVLHRDVNPIIYFHNLKYDGSYILNWLFNHGYVFDSKLSKEKTFSTSISDMGLWYFIEVCIYKHGRQKYIIKFQDSLKKIPLPVRDIPKAFGLEDISKGELDYDTYRPIGHEPTKEELEYLYPDCVIVARALIKLMDEGFTKMTGSSDAFYQWKLTLQSDKARAKGIKPDFAYRRLFPKLDLELDDYIRRAYRGGWTYVNPKFAGQIITRPVEVWDINSMYPHKMKERYLPYGEPIHFTGKPKPNRYQCYICKVWISFEIKPNHLPCIQVKNSYFFNPTEYITSSEGNEIEMTLTNIDLKLIFSQYDVTSIKFIDGYYFYKCKGVFNKHIDKNMEIKEHSTGALRTIAKGRMNQVYGKTATSPRRMNKIPRLEDNILKFSYSEEEISEPQYTALGVFITSWARHDIIKDAQANYENFIYCDTDSLHMLANEDGTEPNLPIHQTKLGFYKKEHNVIKSTFLRSKTYIEQYENGDIEVKCAGASPEVKKHMDFSNFVVGMSFEGKLMPRQVEGGCILKKSYFTIK